MVNFVQQKLGGPFGAPFAAPANIPQSFLIKRKAAQGPLPPPETPGQGLPRSVTYLADYGGCALYRCMGPNMLLNLYNKAVAVDSTLVVLDANYYRAIKALKMQRQATPQQLEFYKLARKLADTYGFKLMYEIDDVPLSEDIPLYNRNRDAFTDPAIRSSIVEMMKMSDEITTTCEYFKDYIIEKTGNKNVTVIPNYLMKWWFDRYYDLGKLVKQYDKNKKKPNVSIFAAATHVDVAGRNNGEDDFTPVLNHIIKTRRDFQWQFFGGLPHQLRPFVQEGSIKWFPWTPLAEFPRTMAESNTQVAFATLLPNRFNLAKSDIKLVEAGAMGFPCVCPDLQTYSDAWLKYSTPDEFIDRLKQVLKDQTTYANECKKARAFTETRWLDDEPNLMKHHEAMFTPFGDPARKYLR